MANRINIKSSYRLPLIIAAIIHILLIVLLSMTLPTSHYQWHPEAHAHRIIDATAINSQVLDKQIKQIKWEQSANKRKQEKELRAIEQRTLLVSQQRKSEERHLQAIKIKQEKIKQQRLAEERQARQRAVQAKAARQKRLVMRQKALQEELLQKQMDVEHKQIVAERDQLEKAHVVQMRGVVDKYRAEILQVIEGNWHPLQQNSALYCQMVVHLAPGGVVTSVDLVKSSGDSTLDRSARVAIFKSSPLPVPKDASLFDQFRQFRIKMSPQDVKGINS